MHTQPASVTTHQCDPVAVAARRAEVSKLLAHTDRRRAWLSELILSGRADGKAALEWNRSMPSIGLLGDLWDEFIALPQGEQAGALASDSFKGMSWQSLMQSCPYFEPSA